MGTGGTRMFALHYDIPSHFEEAEDAEDAKQRRVSKERLKSLSVASNRDSGAAIRVLAASWFP